MAPRQELLVGGTHHKFPRLPCDRVFDMAMLGDGRKCERGLRDR